MKVILPVKTTIYNISSGKFKSYLIHNTFDLEEEWKEIMFKGLPSGYFISNFGNVKDKNGNKVPLYYDKDGYTRFSLYIKKNNPVFKNPERFSYPYKTHRAVAESFIINPDPENNKLVLHKNDIRDCNFSVNLRWGSSLDNMNDKKFSGRSRYLKGSEKPDSKFSEKDVKKICEAIYKMNITKKNDIIKFTGKENESKEYIESYKNLIANIKKGHCWKFIRDQYL